MKEKVIEAVGDLGHEQSPESPIAKLGQPAPPESPVAKLGHAQPEPEELEPEEAEFDARDYVTSRVNLGDYLEPMGFVRKANVRAGVTSYALKHVPLPKAFKFVDDDDQTHAVTWVNIYVRHDGAAAIPFWRVLIKPGHDAYYYTDLQLAKIVRVPDKAEEAWVPDAVAAAKEAVELVNAPHRSLTFLMYALEQLGFKEFNR